MFMVFHVTLYLSLKLMNIWWEIFAIKLQQIVYECIIEKYYKHAPTKYVIPLYSSVHIVSFSSSRHGNLAIKHVWRTRQYL